jgi:hypothetical protein
MLNRLGLSMAVKGRTRSAQELVEIDGVSTLLVLTEQEVSFSPLDPKTSTNQTKNRRIVFAEIAGVSLLVGLLTSRNGGSQQDGSVGIGDFRSIRIYISHGHSLFLFQFAHAYSFYAGDCFTAFVFTASRRADLVLHCKVLPDITVVAQTNEMRGHLIEQLSEFYLDATQRVLPVTHNVRRDIHESSGAIRSRNNARAANSLKIPTCTPFNTPPLQHFNTRPHLHVPLFVCRRGVNWHHGEINACSNAYVTKRGAACHRTSAGWQRLTRALHTAHAQTALHHTHMDL